MDAIITQSWNYDRGILLLVSINFHFNVVVVIVCYSCSLLTADEFMLFTFVFMLYTLFLKINSQFFKNLH